MLREYADITSRLGEPLWWDDQGVPRYDPFEPSMTGVYDRAVALLLICCQSCGRRFRVAAADRRNACPDSVARTLPVPEDIDLTHYGDPPRHECVGDTMTSDTLAVLRFWVRNKKGGWERRPEREALVDEDAEGDGTAHAERGILSMSQQATSNRSEQAAERRARRERRSAALTELWEEVARNAPQCPWCGRSQMRRGYGPYPGIAGNAPRDVIFECHECGSELMVPEQYFLERMPGLPHPFAKPDAP